jgi:hypothetical protein
MFEHLEFSNSSFANSRGNFPLGYIVLCMIHPIFFKTFASTTTFLILMHAYFCQTLLTCQKHKNIFIFNHTFLQSNKALTTWYNNLQNIGNHFKYTMFSLQRLVCTHHLKSTQVSTWNAQYNALKHKPLKPNRNINHWNPLET